MMYLNHVVFVLCMAAVAVGTPPVATDEVEAAQETARFSIIDEFEKLTSGTKSLFSDMNALRNSPVMQSLLSRLMQRGSYMTQLPVEKKQDSNKNPVVQRVENVQIAVKPAVAAQTSIATVNKKSSYADKTKVADDPTKYFKMGDMTLAGAMGLGALALGALLASPVVGAGFLSRSDDDPTIASKKSWMDSLAFWKEDKDGENFYEVPVVVNKGQEQYYNPYHDLGDGTGYDPSIIKYEDEDIYGDYNDEGTRLDKSSLKKSYYSNYAADDSRPDKTKKKKTYYSDDEFWNDHYYKDGVIYERGSNLASPYSYQGRIDGSGYYDSKKRVEKKPYSRNSYDDPADYGSASEGSSNVYDSYSIRDHGSRYYEEDEDKVYVTVNEINKIANESLKDILKHYQNYLRRVDGNNVVYADLGAEDYQGGSSKDRSPVYSGKVGGGDGSDWQPLEIYGDYNDWDSGYENLKNHRIPNSEPFVETAYSEPLSNQQSNKPKPRIRRPQPSKMEPSQPDYQPQRNSNRERLIYAAPQVGTATVAAATDAPRRKLARKTKVPDKEQETTTHKSSRIMRESNVAAVTAAPRRRQARKTKIIDQEQQTTTQSSRIIRESNVADAPNEKDSFPADILVKELTDYQKAYARRFGSQ